MYLKLLKWQIYLQTFFPSVAENLVNKLPKRPILFTIIKRLLPEKRCYIICFLTVSEEKIGNLLNGLTEVKATGMNSSLRKSGAASMYSAIESVSSYRSDKQLSPACNYRLLCS